LGKIVGHRTRRESERSSCRWRERKTRQAERERACSRAEPARARSSASAHHAYFPSLSPSRRHPHLLFLHPSPHLSPLRLPWLRNLAGALDPPGLLAACGGTAPAPLLLLPSSRPRPLRYPSSPPPVVPTPPSSAAAAATATATASSSYQHPGSLLRPDLRCCGQFCAVYLGEIRARV
jgi:hypothetical protein